MAKLLLGVSGGIAAYKALELARMATLAGHRVRVVMTEGATRFVGAASFAAISGAPVLSSEFERDPLGGAFPGDSPAVHDPIGHLALAANCDAYLVAPASANTIAKLAAGMADSMLTTSFLACAAPRFLAPAMNDQMFEDAATQANLATLAARGVTVIDPERGPLASRGEFGNGRLPEPDRLLALVEGSLQDSAGPWGGLRVLISAGGTREPIDPVRFIGNRSSGRMGFALAAAAAARGASVTLIAANANLSTPPGVRRLDVGSTEQLALAAHAEFASCDVLIMAAAPADFRPAGVASEKLRREVAVDLHLEPTEDILASLSSQRKAGQTIVGFAAEHGAGGLERAQLKLAQKGADLIVLNDVSDPTIGFESAENEVTLVQTDGEAVLGRAPKEKIAAAILERVETIRSPST